MDRQNETIQFLDNLDIALSMDNRAEDTMEKMSIELTLQEIILRASYRDILLVNSILQRASELSKGAAPDNGQNQHDTNTSTGDKGATAQDSSMTASPRAQETVSAHCSFTFLVIELTMNGTALCSLRWLPTHPHWRFVRNASTGYQGSEIRSKG